MLARTRLLPGLRHPAAIRWSTRPDVAAGLLLLIGMAGVVAENAPLLWLTAGISAGYSLSGST
ncbi:MAG TPA: hypothetical protein VHI71_05715 [Actinomycetota bacterium]|nr:hypothetical protein [Actinomycetota bacterium]